MTVIYADAISHHANYSLPAWHGRKDSALRGYKRMIACVSAAREAWQVCRKQQKLLPEAESECFSELTLHSSKHATYPRSRSLGFEVTQAPCCSRRTDSGLPHEAEVPHQLLDLKLKVETWTCRRQHVSILGIQHTSQAHKNGDCCQCATRGQYST